MASDIYAIMGDVLYQKGQAQEAFKSYDKSLSYKEDNIPTLNNYAYYLSLENKDLQRAEQMSYKTVKAEPKNATYLDTYAWILFMQERYAEAKIYIDQALQSMDSTDLSGSIYEHVGDIYYMNGLKEEAIGFWEKAVEKDATLETALWKGTTRNTSPNKNTGRNGKGLIIRLVLVASIIFMASCGSKKTLVQDTSSASITEQKAVSPQVRKLTYVQKVYDNQVFSKNIVGDMTFEIKMGSKEISVPGSLKMRKDEVIRLQLFIPILGTEVGRLEFTPDYVLIVDRLHKEYIKADYSQVDFLREQGISFYSLQALFWNQLLLPGIQK